MTKEQFHPLSEEGAKEVKELVITHGGEEYKCTIVADFNKIRTAASLMMDTKVKPAKKGQEPEVDISIEPIKGGDHLLFMAWESGDEIIKKRPVLRLKAGNILGKWLEELTGDGEEIEKKS